MRHHEISNHDDIIDSRDIIARIGELREELETELSAEERDDLKAELVALDALAGEADSYSSEWSYGATLIRDSYFREYAQDLAEDIGAINKDAPWPNDCIDWDQAARELQQDYTAVDFGGATYWLR